MGGGRPGEVLSGTHVATVLSRPEGAPWKSVSLLYAHALMRRSASSLGRREECWDGAEADPPTAPSVPASAPAAMASTPGCSAHLRATSRIAAAKETETAADEPRPAATGSVARVMETTRPGRGLTAAAADDDDSAASGPAQMAAARKRAGATAFL